MSIKNDCKILQKYFKYTSNFDDILSKYNFYKIMSKPIKVFNIQFDKLPDLTTFFPIITLFLSNNCIDYNNSLEIRLNKKDEIENIEFSHGIYQIQNIDRKKIPEKCLYILIPVIFTSNNRPFSASNTKSIPNIHYLENNMYSLLIFDKKTQELNHFQPWGNEIYINKKNYQQIKNKVEKEYNLTILDFNYDILDNFPKIPPKFSTYWIDLIIEYKLNNPTLSSSKIQTKILHDFKQSNSNIETFIQEHIIYQYSIIYRVLFTLCKYFPELQNETTFYVVTQHCDLVKCILASDCFNSNKMHIIINRYKNPSIEFNKKFKDIDINIEKRKVGSKYLYTISTTKYHYSFSKLDVKDNVMKQFQQNLLNINHPIIDNKCLPSESFVELIYDDTPEAATPSNIIKAQKA